MNPFPVVFAREKDASELTHIRISFSSKPANPSPQALLSESAAKPSPKPVRLRRPGTSRHFSCPKASEFTPKPPCLSAPNAHSKARSFSLAPAAKMTRKLRRLAREAVQLPVVVGREVPKRVDRSRVGSSPMAQREVILNLQTEPAEMRSPRSGKRRKALISRSKSVQGRRRLRMVSNDLDSGRDGASQHVPPCEAQSRAGSPLPQRTERVSALLDSGEGFTTLPVGLARIHYFEKAFGTQLKSGEKRATLVKFLTEVLGVTIAPSSNVRVSEQADTNEFSIVITGPCCPLSRCCHSALVFSFCETHGGKMLCTAACCPSRTVANFYLPVTLKAVLWSTSEPEVSGLSSFELSTHIRRGSYKVVSLRKEMERRGKTQGEDAKGGIFTNEKLKHVSPIPPKEAAGMRLPVFQQANALAPGRCKTTVGRTPLQSIFHRIDSRHNTVRKHQSPAELIEQLSTLLQPV